MRTLTLRAMQQPSYLDVLLDTLVTQLHVIPEDADPIRDPNNLTPALVQIAREATHVGQSWACWANGRAQYWFFVAEMPLTRGTPLVRIDQYDGKGELQSSSRWRCDNDDQWQQCAV
ncbi:MAG TPA: hypothetical protein VHY19_05035 [Steroidobacteraceae bacterium]|nr:hypothetical protein [Steroidobacteraceae bacterium]